MKKISIQIISFIAIIIFIGCKKKIEPVIQEVDVLSQSAFLKVYSSSVGTSRNYVYLNTKALNSGVLLAPGGIFPASVGYAAITPGTTTVNIKDTARITTQPELTFDQNFEQGKYYTLFTYDTLSAIKQKVVEDVITIPADTSAIVRFANLAYSRTAIPNVDLFSKTLNRNIFTNIPLGAVTDFTSFPSRINDTLFVRSTGTANSLTPATTVFSLSAGDKRAYTIVFRGGTVSKVISAYTNR